MYCIGAERAVADNPDLAGRKPKTMPCAYDVRGPMGCGGVVRLCIDVHFSVADAQVVHSS